MRILGTDQRDCAKLSGINRTPTSSGFWRRHDKFPNLEPLFHALVAQFALDVASSHQEQQYTAQ